MTDTLKAKLRTENGLQIVVLPPDVHFDGDEVLVRQDSVSGDVVLSQERPQPTWVEVFQAIDAVPVTDQEWAEFDDALRNNRNESIPWDEQRIAAILRETE